VNQVVRAAPHSGMMLLLYMFHRVLEHWIYQALEFEFHQFDAEYKALSAITQSCYREDIDLLEQQSVDGMSFSCLGEISRSRVHLDYDAFRPHFASRS